MTRPTDITSPVISPARPFPWAFLAMAALSQGALAVPNQGIPPLAPFFQEEMGLSRAQVGLVITSMMVGQFLFALVSGWLADVLGVRRTLALGCVVTGVGLLPLAFSGTYGHLLLLAFLASVGSGLGNPATSKAVVDWFPARTRATAMGVKQTGVPVVGALFAATLPALSVVAGWRSAAAVLAGSVLVATAVVYAVYRDAAPPERSSLDVKAGLKALRSVGANRNVWITALLATVLVGVQFSLVTYLILYLRDALSLPVVLGGAMLAVLQVSALVGRLTTGLVSDRLLHGRRKAVLGAAGGMSAVLLAIMGLLPAGAPLPAIVLLVVLTGGAAIGWHPIFHTMMAEVVEPSVVTTALSFGMMITAPGALSIPPLFGLVADAFGYRPAWVALAGLVAVSTALFLAFMREARAKI